MSSDLTVAIVVTTYDRPDDVQQCVQSIQKQTCQPDEVIVIDGGEVNETREALDNIDLSIACVEGPGNGLPAARNKAIQYVESDIIGFVDDDTILPPNWLSVILEIYKDGDPDGVGGSVMNYTPESIGKGNMNSTFYRIVTAIRTIFFYDRIGDIGPMGILYAPLTFHGTNRKEVESFQGCNMTFRSDIFNDHKFDEWYGRNGTAPIEEVDFCTRLIKDGKQLIYTPRAVAIHKRTMAGGERDEDYKRDFRGIRNATFYSLQHSQMRKLSLILLMIKVLLTTITTGSTGTINSVREGYREYKER